MNVLLYVYSCTVVGKPIILLELHVFHTVILTQLYLLFNGKLLLDLHEFLQFAQIV